MTDPLPRSPGSWSKRLNAAERLARARPDDVVNISEADAWHADHLKAAEAVRVWLETLVVERGRPEASDPVE